MYFNETSGEIARWEQYKNAACYLEQILEAAPYKTAAVQPLTSHLTRHMGTIQECCMLFWTNPGSSILQNSSCTATYFPSHKTYGNYTRMLHAVLNKSWKQHLTNHQARHARHCWKSIDKNHKQHSPIDSYKWTQWWVTSYNFHSSALV